MTLIEKTLARAAGGFVFAGTLVLRLVAADAPAPPKTHVLFMGADLEVQQGQAFHRVRGVTRRTFTLTVDGKKVEVPMRRDAVGMKVGHALKLSETDATVDNLRVDRAYTLGNEPSQRFAAALSEMAAVSQSLTPSDLAARQAGIDVIASRIDEAGSRAPGSRGVGPEIGYQIAEMNASLNPILRSLNGPGQGTLGDQFRTQMNSVSLTSTGSDLNAPGALARKHQDLLAADRYDAIELSFNISSEKPLSDPYVLITAQISVPGDKPNEVRTWIYATDLKPVKKDVLHVRIKEGGFPYGYQLKGYQIHLYNRGMEVATNVADRRVELTRDEAFDYVMLDYLAVNKGKTVSPSVAMGRLPTATQNDLQRKEIFVRVGKDGLPLGVFEDARCARRIDSLALEAAMRDFRFRPALEKGQPVDGVAHVVF